MNTALSLETSRAKRLRHATHDAHERLDRSMMDRNCFRSREGYAPFVATQHAFHRDIAALYSDPRLAMLVPGLPARCRLPLLQQDMADLGLQPAAAAPPLFRPDALPDVATALGWLYVAEGSNLGAALLRKMVAEIGLSDTFGARHLAPAAQGPAVHWRAFVARLDAIPLTEAEDTAAEAAACAAFAHVADLADGYFH